MDTHYHRGYAERGIDNDPPGSPIPFVASTPGVKRDGLDLRAQGWRLDNYRRNPVFLWAHGRAEPSLGRVEAANGEQLRTRVFFDQEDEFARRIESKYRRGFLNAVSVGWDFVDSNGQRADVWRMTLDEIRDTAFYDLTELSGVPVPADPDALVQRAGLSRISRRLLALFDEQETPESTITPAELRAEVIAELTRLGVDFTPPDPTPPADPKPAEPAGFVVSESAARGLLAALKI